MPPTTAPVEKVVHVQASPGRRYGRVRRIRARDQKACQNMEDRITLLLHFFRFMECWIRAKTPALWDILNCVLIKLAPRWGSSNLGPI